MHYKVVNRVGGVVSTFFLVTDCFDKNKDDQSQNMGDDCTKKESIRECQILCQETRGCKRFVYVKDTYNGIHGTGMRKCCILKDKSVPIYKIVQGLVSGPAQCFNAISKFTRFHWAFDSDSL